MSRDSRIGLAGVACGPGGVEHGYELRLLLKPVPLEVLPLGDGPTFAAVTLPARPVARSTMVRISGTLVLPGFLLCFEIVKRSVR